MVQVNDVVVHDKEGGSHTLVATVEDITDRLRLAEDLRRAQQMEALGQLAGGIAHEINTPTQFISDNLSFLSDIWGPVAKLLGASEDAVARLRAGDAPGDVAATLEQARQSADLDFVEAEVPTALSQSQEGIERVATIVRAMKAFGRPDPSDPEPTDIDRLVTNAITVARNELKYVAEVTTDLGALPTGHVLPRRHQPGRAQPARQCRLRRGRVPRPAGQRGQIGVKTWAEADRVLHRRERHRAGHTARCPAPHIPAFLHHQALRAGHRPGPGHGVGDGRGPPQRLCRRIHIGGRDDFRGPAAIGRGSRSPAGVSEIGVRSTSG